MPCGCPVPVKLAGIAVAPPLCWGENTVGWPGTLNGVGAGIAVACGDDEAEGCPGTLNGDCSGITVACGGDEAGCPGMVSGAGAGAGAACCGGGEAPGWPGTLNGTGALCG